MPVLSLVVIVPLLASVIIMLIPARRLLAIRMTAAVASGSVLLLSLWLTVDYYQRYGAGGGFHYIERLDWIPVSGIAYQVGADGISLAMVLLTALVIFAGSFASWTIVTRAKEFYALLLLLVAGVFGVFISLDLFFFFLFYEIAVLPMYLLIGIWGTGPKEYAAMKLTLYLLVGSAFALVGLLAVYFTAGTADVLALTRMGSTLGITFQRVVFLLFYLGFGILAAIWPLHTWSPDGHASAPTAVSMLHAGVLMKLGAYGVLRLGFGMLPDGAQYWVLLVAVIGTINIVYGALSAMGQKDLKYVIAYSSVSHMGVVMLGMATLTPTGLNGSVLQMFSHGVMTGLFFGLVGLVYEKAHTRDIGAMGGFAGKMPGIALAFGIGGAASFGLPGTSGFWAEFMVFVGTWHRYPLLAVIAGTGVVVTAIYVLRLLQRVFQGPLSDQYDHLPDAHTTEWVTPVVMCTVLVAVGVLPWMLVNLFKAGLVPFAR